mgnify:FL=1
MALIIPVPQQERSGSVLPGTGWPGRSTKFESHLAAEADHLGSEPGRRC